MIRISRGIGETKHFLKKAKSFNLNESIQNLELKDFSSKNNVEISKLLIENGINPYERDMLGNNSLHKSCYLKNPDITNLLCSSGIDIEEKNKLGCTALHISCSIGNLDHIITLIKHGCDVDAKTDNYWTPLYWASSIGNLHIVSYLLSNNANPNLLTKEGDSACSVAIHSFKKIEIMKSLLKHGADVNLVHSGG